MPTIRKIRYPSGKIRWQVSHGSPPSRVRKAFQTRRQAELFRASLVVAPGVRGDPPLNVVLDQYLTSRQDEVKARTLLRYWEYAKTFHAWAVLELGEDPPLSALTPGLADRYKVHRLGLGRSVKTVRGELEWISSFSHWAVRVELLERNPLKGRVAYPRKKRRLPQAYSVEAVKAILESGDEVAPLCEVAYRGGLRLQEILDLKVGDYLTAEHLLRYRNSKGGEEWFPLSHRLEALLAYHCEGKGQDAHVFDLCSHHGARQNAIRQHFYALLDRLGIERLRFHDLKASAVTHLLQAGVAIHIVQQFARHRNISTTMRYIQPASDDAVRQACDRLPL